MTKQYLDDDGNEIEAPMPMSLNELKAEIAKRKPVQPPKGYVIGEILEAIRKSHADSSSTTSVIVIHTSPDSPNKVQEKAEAPEEVRKNESYEHSSEAVEDKPAGEGSADDKVGDDAEPKYKFGSTQVNLPAGSPAYKAIIGLQKNIPKESLAGDGKDLDKPHVTVRYGLKSGLTPELRAFIESKSPFEVKLGKTNSFPPSEHSDGAAPLVVPIISEELHDLNKEIEKQGDFAPSSFPDYRPHVTVAYLNPEVAEFYEEMKGAEGKEFTVDTIVVSDRNGDKVEVPLKGVNPSAEQKTLDTSDESNSVEKGSAAKLPEQVEGDGTGTTPTAE